MITAIVTIYEKPGQPIQGPVELEDLQGASLMLDRWFNAPEVNASSLEETLYQNGAYYGGVYRISLEDGRKVKRPVITFKIRGK